MTKETQDLKVKVEGHKRENRRLSSLIDQQKDDSTRLAVRLAGTEKQRDDALEALVLQQEIAEELERERKRNKKELAAMQHTTLTIQRQRDEARRVVLHLRSLISGQSHHMEHLVKSLANPDELAAEVVAGFEDEDEAEGDASECKSPRAYTYSVASSAAFGSLHFCADGFIAMESRLVKSLSAASSRISEATFSDIADRHLKDKTDAIAHIIRNIAEQCHAAVEGLALAHDAEFVDRGHRSQAASSRRDSNMSLGVSEDGRSVATSDAGDDSMLRPASGRTSSVPPTPDLVTNRSSTSMSIASISTAAAERSSQQYVVGHEIPTKIVEDDEDELAGDRSETEGNPIPQDTGMMGKPAGLIGRAAGARISALGGTR